MMKTVRRLAADNRAAAAAEMALLAPLLVLLMLGSVDVGNYFLSEHIVQKGVRDAARYASRLPISAYPACTETSAAETQIQKVARTGEPDGTTARVVGWTDDTMTDVRVDCLPIGTYTGIYDVYPFPDGIPIVTVSASVPYESLFGVIGLGSPSLTLNATSQSAIFAQ
jgi:Flp pilus assembly pilin Flp